MGVLAALAVLARIGAACKIATVSQCSTLCHPRLRSRVVQQVILTGTDANFACLSPYVQVGISSLQTLKGNIEILKLWIEIGGAANAFQDPLLWKHPFGPDYKQ